MNQLYFIPNWWSKISDKTFLLTLLSSKNLSRLKAKYFILSMDINNLKLAMKCLRIKTIFTYSKIKKQLRLCLFYMKLIGLKIWKKVHWKMKSLKFLLTKLANLNLGKLFRWFAYTNHNLNQFSLSEEQIKTKSRFGRMLKNTFQKR